MSAFVLRIRDALNEVSSDWIWSFSPLFLKGENKFKFVARQKQTGLERTVLVSQDVLERLPLRVIVNDISRFLPLRTTTLKVDDNNAINVRDQYKDLRADYRDELEKVRKLARQSSDEKQAVTL